MLLIRRIQQSLAVVGTQYHCSQSGVGLVRQSPACSLCCRSQWPSDTNQTLSLIRLTWTLHVTTALRFSCFPRQSRTVWLRGRARSFARASGACSVCFSHGSNTAFYPHCAERDISSKRPRVSIMDLSLFFPVVRLQVTPCTNHNTLAVAPLRCSLCSQSHPTPGLQQMWVTTQVGQLHVFFMCKRIYMVS